MSQLRKLIVLTPEQLHRLRGRDRELTDHYDTNRLQVLGSVVKKVKQIGPTQAYAQYQAAQQRHLHHASRERNEPLQMALSDPPAPPPTLQEELKKLEEKAEHSRLQAQLAREQEGARLAERERRARESREQEEESEKRRKREAENKRRASKVAEAKKREKEDSKLRRAARLSQKAQVKLPNSRTPEARRERESKENTLHSKVTLGGVHIISPLKTRSSNVKRGAEYLLEHPGEARWLKLRQ